MIEVIPSILVDSQEEFEKRLRLVEGIAPTVQVDVLDGSLFSATNWFDAERIGAMQTNVNFELHLMVENPLPIITEWKAHVPGTHRAIIHAEIDRQLGPVLSEIRDKHKLETGIALNPETPLSFVEDYLDEIDTLLIMGVHPGKSGQAFLGESVLAKIHDAHQRNGNLPIGVDGGVNAELLPSLVEAGATRLCAASSIFSADNPQEALNSLIDSVSTNE